MTTPTRPLPTIAVLTSRYPALSETFVWREVRAISARGWPVLGVSMHPPNPADLALEDLPNHDVLLRDRGVRTLLLDAGREVLRHPLRSMRTLYRALVDSLWTGESTSQAGRARNLLHAASGLAAARRLRPFSVAHIHCHFAHAPAGVGMYAAAQLGIDFSFVGHANDIFSNRLLLRRKIERAAFVSCISDWHRKWYGEQAPGHTTPLHVIRCGVDIANHSVKGTVNGVADGIVDGDSDVIAEESTPHPSSAGDGPLRVLSVARLVPKKGLDRLITALARASEQHGLAWTLRIAGDGPEFDALAALAERCGVADRVTLLGAIGPSRVQSLLIDADLFVLPCRVDQSGDQDGIPVALMEAMAAGLPVVAGDLPTLRELIIPDETGILCDAEDVDGMADTIAQLAGDPERRRALSQRGRQYVSREFSLDSNALRLDAALRSALGIDPVTG